MPSVTSRWNRVCQKPEKFPVCDDDDATISFSPASSALPALPAVKLSDVVGSFQSGDLLAPKRQRDVGAATVVICAVKRSARLALLLFSALSLTWKIWTNYYWQKKKKRRGLFINKIGIFPPSQHSLSRFFQALQSSSHDIFSNTPAVSTFYTYLSLFSIFFFN